MDTRQYMLAIKRNNNDYLPLEWESLDNYEGENLSTLNGIDKYTIKQEKLSLLTKVVLDNLISEDELYKDFVIIYKEKGRNRELKEGPIFIDKKDYLNFENAIRFIAENITDKNLLNQICNLCLNRDINKTIIEFVYIIKKINHFENQGMDIYKVLYTKFSELDYPFKRRISCYINNRFIKNTNKNILKKEIV